MIQHFRYRSWRTLLLGRHIYGHHDRSIDCAIAPLEVAMLHSTLRTSFLAACIAGLVGCSDGTPLAPEPIDEVRVVFTESVVGIVDVTIDDASTRLVGGLADPTFAAQLNANLDELSSQVAARDLARAE